MKNTTITIILCLLLTTGAAATPYLGQQYTYDGAGNRIKREYVTITLNPDDYDHLDKIGSDKEPPKPIEQTLADCEIKAYPNPVKSSFTLEVSNLAHKEAARLIISDMSGREIMAVYGQM